MNVRAGGAVSADYRLRAGQLRVDPGSITASVKLGGQASRTLTITDVGSAPATLQIGQQPDTSTLSSASAARGAALERIPGT